MKAYIINRPCFAKRTSRKALYLIGVVLLLQILMLDAFSQTKPEFLSRTDACHLSVVQQVSVARKAFVADAPLVRVAYVIPSNRTAQTGAVANLQYAVKVGQQWFKDNMEQNGFEGRTFSFETEEDGVTPKIHVVNVAETDEYLRGDLWGRTIEAAVNAGITVWASGEVWVLIPEAHVMMPDGSVTGGVALGASFGTGNSPGVAMIGSNALPLFQPAMITDDAPYDGEILPALGPYPMKQDLTYPWFEGSTFSSIASSNLGALLHEMGHAFGLAHDYRNDTNFHGNLMFNGLRGIRGSLFPEKYPQDYTRLEYAAALILNVSHYFNRQLVVNTSPEVSASGSGLITPQRGLIHVAFRASDSDMLEVAQLRYRGDLVAELPLDGAQVDTAFAVPYYQQGETNPYTIAVHDKQGNATYNEVEFQVSFGHNYAAIPYIRIDPPVPALNQPVTLDASQSNDPDHNLMTVLKSWDVDNDGKFDTEPSLDNTLQYQFDNPGYYLVRLKLIDPMGAESTSTPVSVRIPGERKVEVESLSLIDAAENQIVSKLEDDMVINFRSWESKRFSVRANVSQGAIDRVAFDLKGPVTHRQIESAEPYMLFGDDAKGTIGGRTLLPGEYSLTVTPYTSKEQGIPLTVSFRVSSGNEIAGITLVNAATDLGIGEIKDGDIINLTEIGSRFLSIRADLTGDDVSKVTFDLKGPIDRNATEVAPPYALFGDSKGDYAGRMFLHGEYRLTVTPYVNDIRGKELTISFTVTESFSVVGFTLVDVTVQQTVGELSQGDVIDLSLLGDHKFNISADTRSPAVDKVEFVLQGPVSHSRTERLPPYMLFGDSPSPNGSTVFGGVKLSRGSYTLTATPYASGAKGPESTIVFTVKDGEASKAGRFLVDVYPVPAARVINISHNGKIENVAINLLDAKGNVMITRPLKPGAIEQLDSSPLMEGVYYLKIISQEKVETHRIIIKRE